MNVFLTSLGYNLRNLLNFSGREPRIQFWPYAGLVIGLHLFVGIELMMPVLVSSMAKMQQFALANPDQATITQGVGRYSINIRGYHPELLPNFPVIFHGAAIIGGLMAALLAAAVTRRLRDRGIWPAFALVPAIFFCLCLVLFPIVFANFTAGFEAGSAPSLGLFFTLFACDLAYLITIVLLVVFLAQPGKAAPQATP